MSGNSNINARAQSGFAKADAYDRHRPTYPAASIQLLLEQCRVTDLKHAKIVDLAAGTGIFTEALAARDEEYDIIAIEPHNGMREVLNAKRLSRVTVQDGTAAATNLPDESVDAVFVAQVRRCHTTPECYLDLIASLGFPLVCKHGFTERTAPCPQTARCAWSDLEH